MPSTLTKYSVSSQEMAVQEQQETTPLLAPVGEQLYTNYQLHDLLTVSKKDEETYILLNTRLLARIEALDLKTKS